MIKLRKCTLGRCVNLQSVRRFLNGRLFLVVFAAFVFLIDILTSFPALKDSSDVMLSQAPEVLLKQQLQVSCVLFLCVLNGLVLLFCDEIIPFLASGLMTVLFASKSYDCYHLFMGRPMIFVTVPVFVFVVSALIVNFSRFYIKNKDARRLTVGQSFWGIAAVTVAVTLGGLGKISFADYFSAIYYVIFLGVGMIALYFVFRSRFTHREEYDLAEKFAEVLIIVGLCAALLAAKSIFFSLEDILLKKNVPEWKFRNNYSTFLMICMPAPLMFAKRHRYPIFLSFIMFGIMSLLGSRSGLFLGAVEFGCCLLFLIATDRQNRNLYIIVTLACAAALIFLGGKVMTYFSSRYLGFSPIEQGEQRMRLAEASIRDFFDAPIFGQGLGFKGNFNIYTPKKGAMAWYHMMIPQIIGSMGFVGIIAYGFQIINRVYIAILKSNYNSFVLFLCYGGLLLMSQTNPGEFCPFPYEMLAVMIFVIIETRNEQPIPSDLLNKKKEQGTEKKLPVCKYGASSSNTVQKIGTAGSVDKAGAEKAVNNAVTDTDGAANITNVIVTADTAGAVDTNAVSDAVAVNDAIVANDAADTGDDTDLDNNDTDDNNDIGISGTVHTVTTNTEKSAAGKRAL